MKDIPTGEEWKLYRFMVDQYADEWTSTMRIQADYSDHKRQSISDGEIAANLAILEGFALEKRQVWLKSLEIHATEYRACCTLIWDFSLPQVMYADPGTRYDYVEIDILSLLKHGDLLVRRSDGEIVPVENLTFWGGRDSMNIVTISTGGEKFNEDGLEVVVLDSSQAIEE